jgi:glycosyltransferase involved in cell wall biosynthesis
MIVRMVDYVGNEGGGLRFAVELLKALRRRAPAARVQVVSHGQALDAYHRLLVGASVGCELLDLAPQVAPSGWRFDVPSSAIAGCDVAWLPWMPRHRLPDADVEHVLGSFHDAILLTDPELRRVHAEVLPDERETMTRWLRSPARIVVSAQATVRTLGELFGVPADRFEIVPVSGAHADGVTGRRPAATLPPWAARPFILCPANISAHKNHETLLRGVAAWGAKHALVLTGTGADLPRSRGFARRQLRAVLESASLLRPTRATHLRRLAKTLGLTVGGSIIPVGYIGDEDYYALLERAWAVVMPTLAEGGGSFPVEEALWLGVPVVCSDIPVIREHMERVGGSVLWFDPRNPSALADRLSELERDYPAHKARAVEQIAELRRRSWDDVAEEYWRIMMSAAAPSPA